MKTIHRLWTPGIALIKEHKKALLVLNVLVFGTIVGVMVASVINPDLTAASRNSILSEVSTASGADGTFRAYEEHRFFLALIYTFAANLGYGALGATTLPSLVIPFSGIAFLAYRSVLYGTLFAPVGTGAVFDTTAGFVLHMITLTIEVEGYILAALAAWILGRMTLQPRAYGFPSRWTGYTNGLKATAQLYVQVLTVILVGATFEVVEILWLAPAFGA